MFIPTFFDADIVVVVVAVVDVVTLVVCIEING